MKKKKIEMYLLMHNNDFIFLTSVHYLSKLQIAKIHNNAKT